MVRATAIRKVMQSRKPDVNDPQVKGHPRIGSDDRTGIGLPQDHGKVLKEDREPQREKELVERRVLQDRPNREPVDADSDEKEEKHRSVAMRQERIDAKEGKQPESIVGPEHHQFAVGKVHDPHDAQEQGSAPGSPPRRGRQSGPHWQYFERNSANPCFHPVQRVKWSRVEGSRVKGPSREIESFFNPCPGILEP